MNRYKLHQPSKPQIYPLNDQVWKFRNFPSKRFTLDYMEISNGIKLWHMKNLENLYTTSPFITEETLTKACVRISE